jgi:hypothetical protein
VVFRTGALSNDVVELPGAGIYVLRMSASDGEREVSDQVQLTVVRPGSDMQGSTLTCNPRRSFNASRTRKGNDLSLNSLNELGRAELYQLNA